MAVNLHERFGSFPAMFGDTKLDMTHMGMGQQPLFIAIFGGITIKKSVILV